MMKTRKKARPDLYPNWQHQDSPARQAKDRDGNQCVDCGAQDRTIAINAAGEIYMRYLHAAHVHPLDPDPVLPISGQRLRARCPRCHRLYDLHWKQRAAEVEHQCRLHRILLERHFIANRFERVR